jgi:integrase
LAGYIEDRWIKKKKGPVTGKRERTTRYGKGSRYRVAGIPGVRDESFDTLEDAKTWLRQAGADSERGEFVDPRDGSIALEDYVVRYWQAGVQGVPGTVKRIDERVRLHIRPHLGAVSLRDITPTVLRGYIATLVRELSPRYSRQILSTLSNIFETAIDDKRRERWKASRKDGFHVLRHTYASVILQAGESVVTLARWLGHSSPTITLDYYAHFMPEAGGKGRGAIDALLGQPALAA